MILIPQQKMKSWQPYVFFDKEFTPDECDTIVHLAKGILPEKAVIGDAGSPVENKSIRSSVVRWMNHSSGSQWVFDRLISTIEKVRTSWYPFGLSGFQEPLQVTQYLASEGGHYEWHKDMGDETMSTRKLSLVLLLSPKDKFAGGELEMMGINGEDKSVKQMDQGTVVAFPSWEFHRVKKLTEGERWSLVTWVHGAPFT